MELKIRIKEVKEEKREMTVFEEALFCIVSDENMTFYYDEFISRCKNKLNEIGLSTNDHDGGYGKPLIGTFRTETIRDATPEEVIAWHCLSIRDSCFKTKCFGVTARIRDDKCPKNDGTENPCPARDEWVQAKELLNGKEVILEVVDATDDGGEKHEIR